MDEPTALPIGPDEILQWVEGAAFRKAVLNVPGDYWLLDECILLKAFKPTTTDILLKNAFWNQLRQSVHFGHLLDPERVYGGICSYVAWWQLLRKPTRLAWLLLPMQDISIANRVLAGPAMELILEVLGSSCVDPKSQKIDWQRANFAFSVVGKILTPPRE